MGPIKNVIVFDHDGTLVCTETPDFKLFPGINELLADLEKAGFLLAIWTARPRLSTLASLKRCGIAHYFHVIFCSDDGIGKPHPMGLMRIADDCLKEKMIHIGDSQTDIEGAQSFGIDVIAACWNSTKEVEIFKQKTPFIALKVDDCRKIISLKFGIENV